VFGVKVIDEGIQHSAAKGWIKRMQKWQTKFMRSLIFFALALLFPIPTKTISRELSVRVRPRAASERYTKMSNTEFDRTTDDLRPEYEEAELQELLANGVRGKYAARYREGTNLVKLAPDLAAAFPTEQAVDEALRKQLENEKVAA